MRALFLSLILTCIQAVSEPTPLTDSQLYTFLMNTKPTLKGAVEFFEELQKNPELREKYNAILRNSKKLKPFIKEGAAFQEYYSANIQSIAKTPQQYGFATEPKKEIERQFAILLRSLKRTTSSPVRPEIAQQEALRRIIERHKLPTSTQEQNILNRYDDIRYEYVREKQKLLNTMEMPKKDIDAQLQAMLFWREQILKDIDKTILNDIQQSFIIGTKNSKLILKKLVSDAIPFLPLHSKEKITPEKVQEFEFSFTNTPKKSADYFSIPAYLQSNRGYSIKSIPLNFAAIVFFAPTLKDEEYSYNNTFVYGHTTDKKSRYLNIKLKDGREYTLTHEQLAQVLTYLDSIQKYPGEMRNTEYNLFLKDANNRIEQLGKLRDSLLTLKITSLEEFKEGIQKIVKPKVEESTWYRTKKISENEKLLSVHDEVSALYWWGLKRSNHFWAKRDIEAKKSAHYKEIENAKLKKSPIRNFLNYKNPIIAASVFWSALALGGAATYDTVSYLQDGHSPISDFLIDQLYYEMGGKGDYSNLHEDTKKGKNMSPDEYAQMAQQVLYHIHTSDDLQLKRTTLHFDQVNKKDLNIIQDPTKILEIRSITRNGLSDWKEPLIVINSHDNVRPLAVVDNTGKTNYILPLLTARFSDVTAVEIRVGGNRLANGKDYTLFFDKEKRALIAVLKDKPKGRYFVSEEFKYTYEVASGSKMNKEGIKKISEFFRKKGFHRAANEIDTNRSLDFSVHDLSSVIRESSLYSFRGDPKKPGSKDPYFENSQYFCMCNGADLLLQQALDVYNEHQLANKGPRFFYQSRSTYPIPYLIDKVRGSDSHVQTYVRREDSNYGFVVDATPYRQANNQDYLDAMTLKVKYMNQPSKKFSSFFNWFSRNSTEAEPIETVTLDKEVAHQNKEEKESEISRWKEYLATMLERFLTERPAPVDKGEWPIDLISERRDYKFKLIDIKEVPVTDEEHKNRLLHLEEKKSELQNSFLKILLKKPGTQSLGFSRALTLGTLLKEYSSGGVQDEDFFKRFFDIFPYLRESKADSLANLLKEAKEKELKVIEDLKTQMNRNQTMANQLSILKSPALTEQLQSLFDFYIGTNWKPHSCIETLKALGYK